MANPYAWVDAPARRGWLPHLTEAEVKVLWAIGVFFDRSSADARTNAGTLMMITALSHGAFYNARRRLEVQGLIRVGKGIRKGRYRDYPVTVFRLVHPIPPPPSTSPGSRTRTRRRRTILSQDESSPPDTYSPPGWTKSPSRWTMVLRNPASAPAIVAPSHNR